MQTIKLPIQNSLEVIDLISQYNACVRYCYARICKDDASEKQLRQQIKELSRYPLLDSWLVQCCVKEGVALHKRSDKIVFGGKKNLKLRSEGKITQAEWRSLRQRPITIQGEILQKGNRKFTLRVIEENTILCKLNKDTHFEIWLPKLRKNIRKQLEALQLRAENKQITYSVQLDTKHIWIMFEPWQESPYKPLQGRVMAIDINPNSIGYSIIDYPSKQVIHTGLLDNSKLNTLSGEASNSDKQLYLNNKRRHEVYEVSKFLVNTAKHYRCEAFVMEKLNMKSVNHNKGKGYNRLVNNQWNRNSLTLNIQKRCKQTGILVKLVNPAYSSFCGNLLHGEYPDAIASSIELSRRGYEKEFYPRLISVLEVSKLWKQDAFPGYKDWKELYNIIKTRKLIYRVPLPVTAVVCSKGHIKSKMSLYSLA